MIFAPQHKFGVFGSLQLVRAVRQSVFVFWISMLSLLLQSYDYATKFIKLAFAYQENLHRISFLNLS